MFHRLSFFVVASLMLLANAEFPSCAQSCISQTSPGSCSTTDNACLCRSATYCNATNNCFRDTCSSSDWTTAYDYAVQLCNEAGVTESNTEHPPRKRAVPPAHVRSRMYKSRL